MNRRSLIQLGLVLGVLPAGLVGCSRAVYSFRYRLTIAMRVDKQLRTGSSVNEVRLYDQGASADRFPEEPKFDVVTRAEAVPVDLGPRGYLFGLITILESTPLGSPPGFNGVQPHKVLLPLSDQDWESGEALQQLARLSGERDLPEYHWPVLVRFRDITSPRTAEFVNRNDLAPVYGDGAAIERVTVAITDEPVSREIDRLLPWLGRVKGSLTGEVGPLRTRTVAGLLTKQNFKLEGG